MYTIGRLAKLARLKTDSVRFYERQGLVAPATKTASGYRLYTDVALRRIRFIKHAQRCGLSLAEIGELLQMHQAKPAARAAAYRLAAEKKSEIDKNIAALQAMSDALRLLLAARGEDAGTTASPEGEESPLMSALEAFWSQQNAKRPAAASGVAGAGGSPPRPRLPI